MLTVEHATPLCSVQDLGRRGSMHFGVCSAGALDVFALQLANLALGNRQDLACVEIYRGEMHARCGEDSWISVSGAYAEASVLNAAGGIRDTLRAGSPVALYKGETLRVRNRRAAGCAYLAVAGGIDCPQVLGSRSTDLAAGFGGIAGRALQQGDKITINTLSPAQRAFLQVTCKPRASYTLRGLFPDATLRALPGPEFEQARALYGRDIWGVKFLISQQGNRMGARLTPLKQREHLRNQTGAGMLASHAVAPGTVQLLAQSEAIVLLADAQTTGGYPRVAQVIAADLWKLAQLPPGSEVHFQAVDLKTSAQALAERNSGLARADIAIQHQRQLNAGNCQQ